MAKNFDETVRLQSEKTQEWIRKIKGDSPQQITEGARSVPRMASSSAASFPRRNECLRINCSLIKQEKIEDSSNQICQRNCGKRKDGGQDKVARVR